MDAISLACCLLAFLLYYNTLDAGFVYDDRRAILSNPDLLPTSSWSNLLRNDFWGTPLSDSGSHGSYRPLCVFTFRINYLLGGFQPWGYHLVNVLLHCLATGLVVKVARTVLPTGNVGPTVAGLLFASHPVHTEAVAGIVGRADLAACNFYLLAFLVYVAHMKYRDVACGSKTTLNRYCVCCDSKNIRSLENNNKKLRKITNHYSESDVGGVNNKSKYHNFVVSLRSQVMNCYSMSQNDFCCMRHNMILSALSFVGNVGFGGGLSSMNGSNSTGGGQGQSISGGSSRDNAWCACRSPTAAAAWWCHSIGAPTPSSVATSSNGSPCGCWLRTVKQWSALLFCLLLATAAVLSKETGISVLVVCVLYDVLHQPFRLTNKKQVRSITVVVIALLALLCVRLQMASGNTPSFATADNPTARSPSLITRFLTFSYLPTFNFRLLLCPATLSFDWSMDAIPRVITPFDGRNIITVAFYFTLYKCIKYSWRKLKHLDKLNNSNSQKYQQRSSSRRRRQTELVPSVHLETVCACPVCHHSLSDHHSASCRTSNNNNTLPPSHHSMCICQPTIKSTIRPVRLMYGGSEMTHGSRSSERRTPYAAILLAIAFLTLPFLPATNLFFYVGFVVAERVLYLPSVGYCLLIGLGAGRSARVLKRANGFWRVACVCCAVLLLVAFSARTVRRNTDWRDEESLYRSAIHVNPPKAYGNLGSVLSSQGRTAEAETAYRRALEYRANMADVHYNLGILLQGKQQYDEAIRSYQRAIHFRPSLALAYVNLGAALVAAGRCQEAAVVLRQGSQLDGAGLKDRRTHETARVSALLQLGSLYADQGRLQRALAAYREALHTMPTHYPPQSVYNLLGETLTRLQQFEEAERWYQAALQAQPDHVPAHITYGKLLAKNSSRVVEAEQWFRRAQRLAPSDPSVHHHFGEFLASLQRHAEAAEHYLRAAELKPNDYELVVAAATALRQADRKQDAELWYRQAVQLRPNDARDHTNLGAILHLNGKYSQAAASYREALRLQPDDVTTLTNLHKLYSLMA